MEHDTRSMDFPLPGMEMRMVGHVSDNPESLQFSASKEQMGLVAPIPADPGFNTSMVPDNRVGHDGSTGGSMKSSSIWMSNQVGGEDANMLNNTTQTKRSLPVKRKAEIGPMSNSSMYQESLLPSKRPANLGADFKRSGPAQPNPGSPGLQAYSTSNKEMAQNGSMSDKSGLPRGRPPKKQTTQIKSASKFHHESSEAVRSKMRESLAAALALASQKPGNVSKTEKDQIDATTTNPNPMGPKDSSNGLAVVGTNNNFQVLSSELPPNGNSLSGGHTFQEFQYSSVLTDEDAQFSDNFFVKDDLLQGNGLSWALDFDMQMGEGQKAENADKPQSVKEEANGHRDIGEVPILTPENVAFKIEAELFKLFGGVNKKYKEKGRSLLFNLKDRNNPELRVRVMSGEISPEKLCSMSAEELASKELSEWRTAKAEEMAQMVVLPDTEVDVRRLVKKTHKGEYQVEFERDDGVAEEVSGGTSILTQPRPKKETKAHSPSKASSKDEEKVALEENVSGNQDFSGSLIIQTDGTDLMQGMMVDELKDTEFLPPIVSLDEFMESLNAEPPFENLSADASHKTPTSYEESPKFQNSQASDRNSDSPKEPSSKNAIVFKKHEANTAIKPSRSPEQKVLPSIAPEVEYLWEGILQLNISSSVTVRGLFQSGEKTSTKEWLNSIEIKGRVRIDSFEKFLQELPNSRTRAVMVLEFVLKDKASENQLSNLNEAVDTYVADERLGYAEPAPGVELYLCPPTPRISDILNRHMPKERLPINNSFRHGLVGVVVWRRAHLSNNMSPNSSLHHKNTYKRQPSRLQDSSNVNVNVASRAPVSKPNNSKPEPELEEDNDIPPGFGPMAAARVAKDEDDLPEFNFSGHLNPNPYVPRISPHQGVKMTQRPVDQVRELIKKYGQSGTTANSGTQMNKRNLDFEPWDDDDDIPEWRPQAPHPVHNQPYTEVHAHRPPVYVPPGSRHMGPVAHTQPSRGLAHSPPDSRRVQPPGPLHRLDGGFNRWTNHK